MQARNPDPNHVMVPASVPPLAGTDRQVATWQTHEAMTLLVVGLLGWVLVAHLAGALLLVPWLAVGAGLLPGRLGTR
ncbi:MAG: hypothetical protein D6798_17380 [Deltaproteobacteria bacterium]|nr:MAG: hypothetical protein D6798_17380 [Deltaproteobacteria bacterium]